jgi:acetoin utilization protein AcuB
VNIEEIMTPNPERVRSDDSVASAINMLFEVDVRHLPVVNEDDELVGMLSDRDLRSYSVAGSMQYEGPGEISDGDAIAVGDIMQGDVISVGTDAEISDVIALMIDQKIGAVPVIDPLEGGLLGIVSYIDILRLAEDQF